MEALSTQEGPRASTPSPPHAGLGPCPGCLGRGWVTARHMARAGAVPGRAPHLRGRGQVYLPGVPGRRRSWAGERSWGWRGSRVG